MKDSNDLIIRQALKNWAVQQNPNESGRGRLLLLAKSQSNQEMQGLFKRKLLNKHPKHQEVPFIATRFTDERMIEPINQAHLWLLHISPLRNMV